MKDFFSLSTPAKRFRFVAVVEAITWAALIVAMIVKRVADMDSAIRIPGMTHGIVFMIYLVVAVLAARSLNWWTERATLRLGGREVKVPVIVLALIASIPPFFTVWFEVWARRNGHLGELSAAEPAGDADLAKAPA
ncbi:membrane protein [Gordonia spumicola]|uniref:Membrane protein n=1 Tax=Gordonia spumicola TaxID=589161 RepID=A0A7I9VA08_9ACTN|nr:DUF3817 domain-containing protein [Gordonia spumicola]GEE02159.1 membrane protein [Gordonia spumicola]